ncbi:hypothetical protein [Rhodococcus pyridinivorans]|uniref:hypothetical protein n=1 Tax=Rhodococcus pyridinivorans TaxID=103816 RepID=UPI00265AB2D7|nr:hypothetical protein [Rhodococcus pyridinivorans]
MSMTTVRTVRAMVTLFAALTLVAGCASTSSPPTTRPERAADDSVFYYEDDGTPAGAGYTYAETRGVQASHVKLDWGREADYVYRFDSQVRTWIPDRFSDEWLHRNTVSGPTGWVLGTPEQMAAQGIEEHQAHVGELRARCGDTAAETDRREQCTRPPDWHRPSRLFLAALPTDPRQLHERLVEDTGYAPDQASDILAQVTAVLKTGIVPEAVRTNLLAALRVDPGITVTEGVPNFDGVLGTAYTATDTFGHVTDLIVDPVGNVLIGERVTITTGARPPVDDVIYTLAPGTLLGHTATSYGRADHLGEVPV